MRAHLPFPQLKLTLTAAVAFLLLITSAYTGSAQISISADKTAAILAGTLVGTGVTILSPTLNCPGNANGTFTTGIVDPIGIPNGIILTCGDAKDTIIGGIQYYGAAGPFDDALWMPSRDNGTGGDADLTTLSGNPTQDACILEFDFKAAGDTIKFNYVFGSAEYHDFTCTEFNDVFGFFISGGAYTTPTNIALVPGTTIPVCINSVNCMSGSLCTGLGPGSPFCAYYVNNLTGADSPYVRYAGFTVPLTAIAAVNPCDTYHLKLGIADAVDHILDSGVFIEGGSLSSVPPPTISAAGIPYRVRGCAPGQFQFTIPTALDTNLTIHYTITGTAVNGYDYSLIPDSVILPAFSTTTFLGINPLLVPPAGPKVVTINVLGHNACTGTDTIVSTASITILDSFGFHIITPDTQICHGEFVHIIAVGDTAFATEIHYRWTPSSTLSDDTLLTPDATPTITTTYTLSDSLAPAYGCPVEHRSITIRVYERPLLTVDSSVVKTCIGSPVQLHVYAYPDTVPNTYAWTPPTDLSNPAIKNPIVDPTAAGDITYTITVNPSAVTSCKSTDTIHVHTIGPFILNTNDTAICINTTLQVSVTGSAEYSWTWTPSLFLSSNTVMQPVVSPTMTAPPTTGVEYVVTSHYANCPDQTDSFHLEVDYPYPTRTFNDTLCLGSIDSVDFTVPGATYFHYQWTPATFLSNDTIPNPVITPTVPGFYNWTLIVQPKAIGCSDTGYINMIVTPNSFTITPTDTNICRGASVQVLGTPYFLFNYQWLPTAGIPVSNIINPLITPDTSAQYVVTATFYKCPDMHDTLMMDVQPNPTVYIGGGKHICQGDTLHIHANVNPMWYTHYSYAWSPAKYLDSITTPVVVFYAQNDTVVTVTVSTPKGCKSMDSAKITVYPGQFASIDTDQMTFCPHDSFRPIITGGASYHWSPAMYLSDSLNGQPIISPITSQTYSIIATSNYGCKDTLSFRAIVYAGAVLTIGDSVTLYPGETVQLDPQTNCVKFEWFPPAGLSDYRISNPLASPEISTKYIVTGYTEHGCKAVDSIDVYLDPNSLLALPNAFTPGNGPNNEFKIIKRGIATLKYFRIFNRWGNLVFETTDIDKGWNGDFNGTPQNMGVFVYEVEAVTSAGKIFRKQGNITLLR